MESSQPDLRLIEPPSPESLMPSPITWWVWVIIGLITLIVVGFVILWRLRTKPGNTASKRDLLAEARKQAIAALAACPMENQTLAATECSTILRRHLAKVTGDPALYETHEEWVSRQDSVESFSDDLKQNIHSHFSTLAASKYSPDDHGDSPEVMIENSRQLMEAVNREAES